MLAAGDGRHAAPGDNLRQPDRECHQIQPEWRQDLGAPEGGRHQRTRARGHRSGHRDAAGSDQTAFGSASTRWMERPLAALAAQAWGWPSSKVWWRPTTARSASAASRDVAAHSTLQFREPMYSKLTVNPVQGALKIMNHEAVQERNSTTSWILQPSLKRCGICTAFPSSGSATWKVGAAAGDDQHCDAGRVPGGSSEGLSVHLHRLQPDVGDERAGLL